MYSPYAQNFFAAYILKDMPQGNKRAKRKIEGTPPPLPTSQLHISAIDSPTIIQIL